MLENKKEIYKVKNNYHLQLPNKNKVEKKGLSNMERAYQIKIIQIATKRVFLSHQ
jgi:hypothetical protein